MAVRVLPLPQGEGAPARVAWLARPDADRALGRIDAAIYSYLLDEHDRADLIYSSPRFEALVGTAPTAMAPIDAWRARIHPDDRTVVARASRRLRGGHTLEREYRLILRRRQGALRARPGHAAGRPRTASSRSTGS